MDPSQGPPKKMSIVAPLEVKDETQKSVRSASLVGPETGAKKRQKKQGLRPCFFSTY